MLRMSCALWGDDCPVVSEEQVGAGAAVASDPGLVDIWAYPREAPPRASAKRTRAARRRRRRIGLDRVTSGGIRVHSSIVHLGPRRSWPSLSGFFVMVCCGA